MADEDPAGAGGFLDELVARAKGVGGQVREFTEDAFDHVRAFSAGAGETLKDFASDARDKGQRAYDGLRGRTDGKAGDSDDDHSG